MAARVTEVGGDRPGAREYSSRVIWIQKTLPRDEVIPRYVKSLGAAGRGTI